MSALNFVAFQMLTPGDGGAWRSPSNRRRYLELGYWQEQARLIQACGFDALFFADVLGIFETEESGAEIAVRRAHTFPLGDPLVLISALAPVTRSLGFVITASTSYEQPFHLARRLSTLDHLTGGRIGWNIVTSYLDSAAANFGLASQPDAENRYERADEYLAVVEKLWTESWGPGALVKDAVSGVYADPSKVRAIDHVGEHFSVRGPHLLEPSPQVTPVHFQATMSEAGLDFAARHAEVVYTRAATPAILARNAARLRERAADLGRKVIPKVLAMVDIVVGRTPGDAQSRLDARQSLAVEETALVSSGIDLRAYPRDSRLSDLKAYGSKRGKRASQGLGDATIAQHLEKWRRPVSPFLLVGTPDEVVSGLAALSEKADIDGFLISSAFTPGIYEDFARFLTPRLRERGLLADSHEAGVLLRDRLFNDPNHASLLQPCMILNDQSRVKEISVADIS